MSLLPRSCLIGIISHFPDPAASRSGWSWRGRSLLSLYLSLARSLFYPQCMGPIERISCVLFSSVALSRLAQYHALKFAWRFLLFFKSRHVMKLDPMRALDESRVASGAFSVRHILHTNTNHGESFASRKSDSTWQSSCGRSSQKKWPAPPPPCAIAVVQSCSTAPGIFSARLCPLEKGTTASPDP